MWYVCWLINIKFMYQERRYKEGHEMVDGGVKTQIGRNFCRDLNGAKSCIVNPSSISANLSCADLLTIYFLVWFLFELVSNILFCCCDWRYFIFYLMSCTIVIKEWLRAWNEGYPKVREDFAITEKAPTKAFSWLKAPTRAFTCKTLWRHYAKQALIHSK